MQTLMQDLRYAVRTLLRSPAFTVVSALTLAIGIGANTAIFSIIDAVLLRALPYSDPERLVRLYESEDAPGRYPFAGPDFLDWRTQNTTFTDMSLSFWTRDMALGDNGQTSFVTGLPTEANYFTVLGVKPLLGRTWVEGEDQPGKDDVVILSYGLWRERFGGDPAVLGRSVQLDARSHRIIGVMPAEFRSPLRAQLWTPLDMSSRGLGRRGSHSFNAVGRLKPGASLRAAQAELSAIAARLEQAFPDSNRKVGAIVVPLQEDLVGRSRDSLVMLLSAVGLVLLIACANIANLLLSRAAGRQRELALRAALGASRPRLLRQLLTESLLLSLVGGSLGLLLGWGLIALLPRVKSFNLPDVNAIQLNAAVLAFNFALAVATSLLFGLVPALQLSRSGLLDELKGGAGSVVSPSRHRRRLSNGLVVAEVGLSMLLLTCAGLLLKDFLRLREAELGVRREGIWTAAVRLPEVTYKTSQQRDAFARRLIEGVGRIAGVSSAALSDRLPLEGGSNYYIQVRGRVTEKMTGPLVESHGVTPGYFAALGIPLLKGRLLTEQDVVRARQLDDERSAAMERGVDLPPGRRSQMVYPTIINVAMARLFWPDEDPLGSLFAGGGGDENGPWRQVVGVVGDVRQRGLVEKVMPEAYDALSGTRRLFVVLHTSVAPANVGPPVRRLLQQLDAGLALSRERSMEDVVDDNCRGQRFLSFLVGSFAALAALLAAVGIYGVLSYAVTQRTREIGIRVALGATGGQVLSAVLREGMQVAAAGFALGLAAAFAASRLLVSQLHEVHPRDPSIFLSTAGVLGAIALLACYIPARRAAALDPTVALHHE